MLLKLAFLKSSNVSVSPIDNMRNPSKLVNKPLVHHATDWGLLMPMAAPKQTCAKQAKNVKSHNAPAVWSKQRSMTRLHGTARLYPDRKQSSQHICHFVQL